MTELAAVVTAAREALARGQTPALATVVRATGSTYRRPGARLLIAEQGRAAGSVSGGCLERDLLQKIWWRTASGPALVTYDSLSADEDIAWGFGLGCNGRVDVLLERLTPESVGYLERLLAWGEARQPAALATVIGPEGLGSRLALAGEEAIGPLAGDSWMLSAAREALSLGQSLWRRHGDLDVFVEYVAPPQALVIVGAGQDVAPLVALARGHLGWRVTVIDTRARSGGACPPEEVAGRVALDAQTAVVVMTHHFSDDRAALPGLLASDAGYIGVLGPRRRTERLLAEAGIALTPEIAARLHAPVGLDIGADDAAEIALAVVAEIRAWRAGRGGAALRARSGPIHEPVPCPASA